MSRVVAITGAGGTLGADDVRCLFYGDVFRPPGRPLSVGVPPYTAADVDEAFERELLLAWWAEAARTDPGVVDPDSRTLARVPRGAQAALRALSTSRFFSGLAVRMLVFDLKQVRRYLMDEDVRAEIQDRLAAAVDEDTRVVVGHSLGSVVAYEALAAHRTWPASAASTPTAIRIDVVFPAPFDPTKPKISPDSTVRVIPRRAWTSP